MDGTAQARPASAAGDVGTAPTASPGYGYDPRQVAAEQVPRSAAGFTDPRWRGRVISTYPHEDDVTLYLYSVLVERHGWSFIDQLLASSPQFVNGHLGVAQGGAWSPRLDIAPPPGLAPLAELNVANGFLAFITRTAVDQAYRGRFAALIGLVTGPEYR